MIFGWEEIKILWEGGVYLGDFQMGGRWGVNKFLAGMGGAGGLCPVGSIYTNLVGFIQETSESIAILGFFRLKKFCQKLQKKVFIFYSHNDVYRPLIWVPKLLAPETNKTKFKLL